MALSQVQARSAPHFLFLWRVKEKENAPLAVEKKKKSFWQLADDLVKKQTAALTLLQSACRFVLLLFPLPLVQSFSTTAMGAAAKRGAGQFVTQHHPRKQNIWLEGLAADTHPRVFFFFCTVNGTSSFSSQEKEKEDVGLKTGLHSFECKTLQKKKMGLNLLALPQVPYLRNQRK